MRKRTIWMALFGMALGIVLLGWSGNRLPVALNLARQPVSTVSAPVASEGQAPAPNVNSQRLLNDVRALTFRRYAPTDRTQARDYIIRELEQVGWSIQSHAFQDGLNLYAERPGTDPNAGTILLGAHYDTVEPSPGADDNATSVATILEAARLFASQATPRGLQIVFFDLEEQGLLGSKAFVDTKVQRDQLRGAIVLDMLGYACYTAGCQSYPSVLPIEPPTNRGDFLAVLGDQGHLPLLNSFVQASQAGLPPVQTLAVPTFGAFTPDLVRSDHAPFWKKNLGAVLVTDTANFRNPHYHQPSDTLETIDPRFFQGAAQIVVNALSDLLQGHDSLATQDARQASGS